MLVIDNFPSCTFSVSLGTCKAKSKIWNRYNKVFKSYSGFCQLWPSVSKFYPASKNANKKKPVTINQVVPSFLMSSVIEQTNISHNSVLFGCYLKKPSWKERLRWLPWQSGGGFHPSPRRSACEYEPRLVRTEPLRLDHSSVSQCSRDFWRMAACRRLKIGMQVGVIVLNILRLCFGLCIKNVLSY